MKTINIHEAKTHLSRIIERVAQGESVIIGKAGKPMAVLSPYRATAGSRKPGSMKSKINIADDFDADNDLIADLFEGEAEQR
ncbi:MAG: type II toxin-antitoxin system prevent-host-death family antitoxin [Pseudomonadota bacterium]